MMHIINDTGRAQIVEFLRANHKDGDTLFADVDLPSAKKMIDAWCADAEQSADDGNGACIELKSYESTWGRVQTLDITDEGVDNVADNDG